MPATVRPQLLERWMEALCRLRHAPLQQLATADGTRLRPRCLPTSGAVYCFWWTGPLERLTMPDCSRTLVLKGPGGRPVPIELCGDWLGLEAGSPVPLYVGKTGNLNQRVRGHVYLGKARAIPLGDGEVKQRAPTTTCQLRAGIDHLFPLEPDSRPLLLGNIGLSYVELPGDEHAVDRFYLEDLAIGRMRPPINVDVER